ncbi:MAG: hypothetical protein V2J11_01785 [Desulfofustis sp.]|nr:hypothetical protein [Desulfofustis sp.]
MKSGTKQDQEAALITMEYRHGSPAVRDFSSKQDGLFVHCRMARISYRLDKTTEKRYILWAPRLLVYPAPPCSMSHRFGRRKR